MLQDVTDVRPFEGCRLFLRFEGGVFAPLNDPAFFRAVRVAPKLGTIVWPNGADICPDVLYARATGAALPEFEHAA